MILYFQYSNFQVNLRYLDDPIHVYKIQAHDSRFLAESVLPKKASHDSTFLTISGTQVARGFEDRVLNSLRWIE